MGYIDEAGPEGSPAFTNTPQTTADLNRLRDLAVQRGNSFKGTTAERTAWESEGHAAEGHFWYDTTLDTIFVYSGSGWVKVWPVEASGVVVCPNTAGGGSSPVYWSDLIDVTFPAGRFSAAPKVFVQTIGPASQVPFGGVVEQITTTGCKVRGMRIASVPTDAFSVQWYAVQQ